MGHSAVEGKGDGAADGKRGGAFQLRGGNDHNGIAAAGADVEMDGAAHHLADVHSAVDHGTLITAEDQVLRPDAQSDGAGCRAVVKIYINPKIKKGVVKNDRH